MFHPLLLTTFSHLGAVGERRLAVSKLRSAILRGRKQIMITEESNVFAQGLLYWDAHAPNLLPLCFRSDVFLPPRADLARFLP